MEERLEHEKAPAVSKSVIQPDSFAIELVQAIARAPAVEYSATATELITLGYRGPEPKCCARLRHPRGPESRVQSPESRQGARIAG
jgi:hypothetical protein